MPELTPGTGIVLTKLSAQNLVRISSSLDISALLLANRLYPTTAAGIADTVNGEYFFVAVDGADSLPLYRNVSEVAVDQNLAFPSVAGLSGIENQIADIQDQETIPIVADTGSTADALIMVSPTGDHAVPSTFRQYRFKVPSDYELPTVPTPTLKIDGGTAFGIYDHTSNAIDPEQLSPAGFVTIKYDAGFGGLWQIVEPRKYDANRAPLMEFIDAETGDPGEAYEAASITGTVDLLDANINHLFWFIPKSTSIVGDPTLTLDGGDPYLILEPDGSAPAIGRLIANFPTAIRYVHSGGDPYWAIMFPYPSSDPARDYTARQEADAANRGARQLWASVSGAAFDAIPRSAVLDEDFASAGEEDKYRWMQNTGPGTVETYTEFDHDAGGFIFADLSDGTGLGWDWNHTYPGIGMIQLLAIFHSDDFGSPVPDIPDFTNSILALDLRLRDFFLPPGVRLALLTQYGGPPPALAYNYLHLDEDGRLIDDVAGFGGIGFGFPPKLTEVEDSGSMTLTYKFPPNDAFARCIGWATSRAATYGALPFGEAMQLGLINFMVVAVHPQQAVPTSEPAQKASGTIEIHNVTLEVPD